MKQKEIRQYKCVLVIRSVLAALFGAFIVTVVVIYLSHSLGWFAMNEEVKGSEPGTTIQSDDALAEYVAYIYDVKENVVHYTGEGRQDAGVSIDPAIDNFDMQFFDTIFQQRNRYTPAIVRIRLTKLKSEWLSGGTVVVTVGRNTSFPEYTNSLQGDLILNDFFTSVMRFSLHQNKTWYNSNAGTLYNNVDTALYNQIVVNKNYTPAGSSAVFTTTTKSGRTLTSIDKSDFVTLRTTYTSSDIVSGYLDIYLYISYDTDLVNDYKQAAGIDTSGETIGKTTPMIDDIDSIVVEFEGNN